MQISSTFQNTLVPPTNNEPVKTNTAQQALTTLTASLNKDAFNYLDLGEDISAYTTAVNPKQQQTNQELINYLSTLMNDKTDEGRKNLQAYDISSYHPVNADRKTIWGYAEGEHPEDMYVLPYKEPTEYEQTHPYTISAWEDGRMIMKRMNFQELHDFLGQDYFGNNTSKQDSIAMADRISVFSVTLNAKQKQYMKEHLDPSENFAPSEHTIQKIYQKDLRQTTKEEFDSIQQDKFKNLYSFSDAFAKTDKFQELYATYVNQYNNNKQMEDARTHGRSMAETFGSKSFFTSHVASLNLSKSEIINHYTKISQDLHTLKIPPKGTTYGETYIKQIDDSIKLYEKITNDLKQMWNFGDLDIES